MEGNDGSETVFGNCGWVKENPNVKKKTGSRRSKRKWIYPLKGKVALSERIVKFCNVMNMISLSILELPYITDYLGIIPINCTYILFEKPIYVHVCLLVLRYVVY